MARPKSWRVKSVALKSLLEQARRERKCIAVRSSVSGVYYNVRTPDECEAAWSQYICLPQPSQFTLVDSSIAIERRRAWTEAQRKKLEAAEAKLAAVIAFANGKTED